MNDQEKIEQLVTALKNQITLNEVLLGHFLRHDVKIPPVVIGSDDVMHATSKARELLAAVQCQPETMNEPATREWLLSLQGVAVQWVEFLGVYQIRVGKLIAHVSIDSPVFQPERERMYYAMQGIDISEYVVITFFNAGKQQVLDLIEEHK